MDQIGWSTTLERAAQVAARAHDGQVRKGTEPPLPYASHVLAVAAILGRSGFDETVMVAGLLHDVVEDTVFDLAAVRVEFGSEVADLVAACTEQKLDELGRKRPWGVRKREALDDLAGASVEARAVALADKLHNLVGIELEVSRGRDVWRVFGASRGEVLAYYREAAERWGVGDARLEALGAACRGVLAGLG